LQEIYTSPFFKKDQTTPHQHQIHTGEHVENYLMKTTSLKKARC